MPNLFAQHLPYGEATRYTQEGRAGALNVHTSRTCGFEWQRMPLCSVTTQLQLRREERGFRSRNMAAQGI